MHLGGLRYSCFALHGHRPTDDWSAKSPSSTLKSFCIRAVETEISCVLISNSSEMAASRSLPQDLNPCPRPHPATRSRGILRFNFFHLWLSAIWHELRRLTTPTSIPLALHSPLPRLSEEPPPQTSMARAPLGKRHAYLVPSSFLQILRAPRGFSLLRGGFLVKIGSLAGRWRLWGPDLYYSRR